MERFIMGFFRYAAYRFIFNTIMRNKVASILVLGGAYYGISSGLIDIESVLSQVKTFALSHLN